MTVVRPGPEYIRPGVAPGGVVVQIYDVPSQTLLLTRVMTSLNEPDFAGESDSQFIATLTDECCLVAYDGDTGERMPASAWGA